MKTLKSRDLKVMHDFQKQQLVELASKYYPICNVKFNGKTFDLNSDNRKRFIVELKRLLNKREIQKRTGE